MAAPNYKILGKGTYGAVVAPALPNVDAAGHPVTFGDGYVTKVMFNKKHYDEALEATRQIARNVPALAQNIRPYRRTITNANIAPIPGMTEYVAESHPHHTRVYAMRMPHLGYAFNDIVEDETEGPANMRQRLRSWSNEEICRQVLKLMRIVRDIHAAGYIHADIRETNIMCNLDTKDFTIVDFDWFMPVDEFVTRYPGFFYSHPPEGLYVLQKPNKLVGIQDLFSGGTIPGPNTYRARLNANIDIWSTKYESNIDNFFEMGVNPEIANMDEFKENLRSDGEHLLELVTDLGVAAGQQLFRKKCLGTVDSYGLALSLLSLLESVLTLPHQLELRVFLVDELLPEMMQFRLEHRLMIDDAISLFEEFLAEQMLTVAADLDLEDELNRLRAISPDVVEAPMPRQRRLSSARRSNLRKQVEGYAALVGVMMGIQLPSASKPTSPSSRTKSSSGRRKTASSNKKKSAKKARSTRKKSPK